MSDNFIMSLDKSDIHRNHSQGGINSLDAGLKKRIDIGVAVNG